MIRFEGESFGGFDGVRKENEDAGKDGLGFDLRVKELREEIIGQDQIIISPPAFAAFPDALDRAKTQRRIVYTDFTATGRGLASIENFIASAVLPWYGNTHSLSTATARQSTYFRNEARQVIANYYNCTHEDAVIFTGNGATGAIDKMVGMLIKSGGFNVEASMCEDGSEQHQVQRYFSEDRWHSFQVFPFSYRLLFKVFYIAHDIWS